MAPLRDVIMAALSEGYRRSAHPADRQAQNQEAARIALAIQAEFVLLPKPIRPELPKRQAFFFRQSHE